MGILTTRKDKNKASRRAEKTGRTREQAVQGREEDPTGRQAVHLYCRVMRAAGMKLPSPAYHWLNSSLPLSLYPQPTLPSHIPVTPSSTPLLPHSSPLSPLPILPSQPSLFLLSPFSPLTSHLHFSFSSSFSFSLPRSTPSFHPPFPHFLLPLLLHFLYPLPHPTSACLPTSTSPFLWLCFGGMALCGEMKGWDEMGSGLSMSFLSLLTAIH